MARRRWLGNDSGNEGDMSVLANYEGAAINAGDVLVFDDAITETTKPLSNLDHLTNTKLADVVWDNCKIGAGSTGTRVHLPADRYTFLSPGIGEWFIDGKGGTAAVVDVRGLSPATNRVTITADAVFSTYGLLGGVYTFDGDAFPSSGHFYNAGADVTIASGADVTNFLQAILFGGTLRVQRSMPTTMVAYICKDASVEIQSGGNFRNAHIAGTLKLLDGMVGAFEFHGYPTGLLLAETGALVTLNDSTVRDGFRGDLSKATLTYSGQIRTVGRTATVKLPSDVEATLAAV